MSERYNSVHEIEYNRVLQHAIVVEFAEVLDFSDATLQKSEVVLLEPKAHGLDDVVNNSHNEVGVVAVHGAQQNSQQVNVAELHLSRLREDLLQNTHDLLHDQPGFKRVESVVHTSASSQCNLRICFNILP